ncbi:Glyoxalase-like domain protein [Streptomyces sp. YIM 130001]|uniref:VOC family protein n=1 Tax=Streptomyces sp. YIM 130001 TaxID=2259644 RepID=UPI000E657643|nr:VOC family protein [Streptomyces sp. YIM 130001]RII17930.1 Glyoxalase-like domain protein [Streptomyces sp. YIM 130001]
MSEHRTAASATSSREVVGAPCWATLLTHDLTAAESFYGEVFGWTFAPASLGEDFRVALQQGKPVAGIGALISAPVVWTPYFAVADADATAARIRERSATVAVGPLRFPVGRGALAADRDGAVFGIWEGRLISDWHSWRADAPVWIHLRSRDAFAAAIFYGQVLDWACGRPGCCEVEYENDEVVLLQEGRPLARLSSGAVDTSADLAAVPRWDVCFAVSDPSSTVRAALDHGGSVVRRGDQHDPTTTLCDPLGGVFTITETWAPSRAQ